MEKDIYIYFLKKELTHPSQQQFKKKKGELRNAAFSNFNSGAPEKGGVGANDAGPECILLLEALLRWGEREEGLDLGSPPALDVHMYWFRLQPGNSTAVVYLLPNIEDNSSASPVLSISFKCLCPSVIIFQLWYLSHHVSMIARA